MKKILIRICAKNLRILKQLWDQIIVQRLRLDFGFIDTTAQIPSSLSLLGGHCIRIGKNFSGGPRLKLWAHESYGTQKFQPSICIGDDVVIHSDCYLSAINKITLGNHVVLASRITIIDHNHGKSDFSDLELPVLNRELSSRGAIDIEDNVWLGEGVVVLGGVRIGRNSIVGACSVVTKTIPPNSIAVGNPARVIKKVNS